MEHVVIVGGGLTAAHAVETFRAEGFSGGLTLLCEESHLPYERPPLSKGYLLDGEELDETTVHDAAWYSDHEVEVRRGSPASGLDLERRTVYADGVEFSWDAILLATGAAPFIPPIQGIDHALTLRTREDARALKAELRPGREIAIIGAGWIGLEVAAAARQRGCAVTVVEQGDLPLGRILGSRIANYVRVLHGGHGVDLRLAAEVTAVRTDDSGHVVGLATDSGEVNADVVVNATGVRPRVELAVAAGLRAEHGIETDERFHASASGVFAAGDVANVWHVPSDHRLRVEHWDNAIRQGQAVAKSMLGADSRFDWHPYFFTDQFEFSMEYVGHAAPTDQVEIRGDMDQHEFVAYWLRNGILTAAMNVNTWDVNERLRELIGTRLSPSDLDGVL